MSETDAPLKCLELDEEAARQWPPQTAEQFLEMIGEEPKTPLRESPPENFFEELLAGNEENEDLVNVKLYRVGEIEIDIYLLGKGELGKVCGLQTLSVET